MPHAAFPFSCISCNPETSHVFEMKLPFVAESCYYMASRYILKNANEGYFLLCVVRNS